MADKINTAAMPLIDLPLEDIHPYERNPRRNAGAVDALANAIRRFGYRNYILVDEAHTIICGHTRLLALKKLGYRSALCHVAEGMTPEEARAYRLADNKVAELAEWDDAMLAEELGALEADFDMADFGFEVPAEGEDEAADSIYTGKINIPQYEITGDCPPVAMLADTAKRDAMLAEIDKAEGVPEDVRGFLRLAAWRHVVFDYQAVAEFYAHAGPEVQRLFEASALVIIDYDDAIAGGYAKLCDALDGIRREEGR